MFFSVSQQQLPATGVPVTQQRFDHMKELFDEYVKSRTLQNWKFWIVSFWMQQVDRFYVSWGRIVNRPKLSKS